MKILIDNEYSIMWEAFGYTIRFEPDHNYMGQDGPPFDMPATMQTFPPGTYDLDKCTNLYEVGLGVITDY